jgi:hypothetical protein
MDSINAGKGLLPLTLIDPVLTVMGIGIVLQEADKDGISRNLNTLCVWTILLLNSVNTAPASTEYLAGTLLCCNIF